MTEPQARSFGPGEHPPEELLSAHLDGGLEPAEHEAVAQHLTECSTCREKVEQLQLVREVMRTLPFVEPPAGFYERTLRLGPRPTSTASQRFGATLAAGIVGLLAVIVTLAVVQWRADRVRPEASTLARAFAAVEVAASVPAPPPAGLPLRLGDYTYVGRERREGIAFAIYERPGRAIGITWWDAELGGLPADGGEVVPLATGEDDEGWWTQREASGVACVERGDRVYAVVGPAEEDLARLAAALPPRSSRPTVGDRLRSAGRSLLEAFGFGG